MYEAYSSLQKADALVHTINSAGHAIMAVSVHTERLEDGTIQGSYPIAYVQVQITDTAGIAVQEPTCFGLQEDMYQFELGRFTCRLGNGDEIAFREGRIEK